MYRNQFWRFLAEIWPKKITSRDGCILLMETLETYGGGNPNSGRPGIFMLQWFFVALAAKILCFSKRV